MMNGREVTRLLVLFTAALALAEEGIKDGADVWIKGYKVTLVCPLDNTDGVTWEKDKITVSNKSNYEIENYTQNKDGLYSCMNNKKTHTYYFYTSLHVCKGCVELDVTLAMGIMFGDVLITLGVILMVYLCAKRKAAPASAPPQRAQRRQPSSAPPSEPAYQALNPGTRGKDVYSDVKRKK
ncbi:T-cell surface glycoprotein CD3 epsilon chain-like [Salminus brasiliensis]|uniref:T-cell surface glycoprotein CD3 epsilon chain-like n=1 Tax=Salminus brasiliensis TaxID=930266 RepID=UPI003B82C8E0